MPHPATVRCTRPRDGCRAPSTPCNGFSCCMHNTMLTVPCSEGQVHSALLSTRASRLLKLLRAPGRAPWSLHQAVIVLGCADHDSIRDTVSRAETRCPRCRLREIVQDLESFRDTACCVKSRYTRYRIRNTVFGIDSTRNSVYSANTRLGITAQASAVALVPDQGLISLRQISLQPGCAICGCVRVAQGEP